MAWGTCDAIRRKPFRHGFVWLTVLTSLAWTVPSATSADDTITLDNRSFKERQHERADDLRRGAKAAAQSRLGYPYYADDATAVAPGYAALSQQIARLAGMLQRMAEEEAARAAIPQGGYVPSGPPVGRDGLPGVPGAVTVPGADIYGPGGPSVRAVRLLLDYKLLLVGNPRLSVGEVREEDNSILATVVTTDGALVEEYRVDKSSGVWVPVR